MSIGQQLGVDMANTFMLTLLFNLIADMSENPEGFLRDTRTALCELADDHKLPGVAPEIAQEASNSAKQVSLTFSKMQRRSTGSREREAG